MRETLVIGASAAGLSAAIYLARRGVDSTVVAKDVGGEMALSGEIGNYPGLITTNGIELSKKMREHALAYQVTIEEGVEASGLSRTTDGFSLEAKVNGSPKPYEAKTVIITTGAHPKKLRIPGEEAFYHKGVTYCTVCDGPLFAGKPVAIVGGGNSALEAGLMMATLSPKVYVITKNPAMKGEMILSRELFAKPNVEFVPNALTQEIVGGELAPSGTEGSRSGFVTGLRYLDTASNQLRQLAVEAVFIHVGLKPNTDWLPTELGITTAFGEITVNKLCQTNIPGLFAAGDVTDIPYKQIGVAVGQGITAALSAISYLNSRAAN